MTRWLPMGREPQNIEKEYGMDPVFQYDKGDCLDSFEITDLIYAGPLAQVYQALDTLTQEAVAIKVPSLDIINNPLVYYHFQNESRVLDKIRHPRIVRYIHRDKSSAYNVFEYIPGVDLRDQMRTHGVFSFSKARHYISQIAQGLAHLHNCGIIHLDIKPENILLTPMDTVKIVDFGLARKLGTPDVLQQDFTMPHGTPYYAAPEQLSLYRDEPRTDIYSLAMVYYELLTGRLPFEKSQDPARVRRRLKVDPVPPRHYRPEIPEAIEQVILEALSRAPEARHASAEAFIKSLDRSHLPMRNEGDPSPSYPVATEIACPIRSASESTAHPRGMVVALDDTETVDAVVQAALRASIANSTAVTLLTVVSGDKSDDWNRYGDEVRGKRWGRKLAHYARQFQRLGIDPVVRIRDGVPADVIVETAVTSRADLIIMGPPGKGWFKGLFGRRTIDRVMKRAPCRVKVIGGTDP